MEVSVKGPWFGGRMDERGECEPVEDGGVERVGLPQPHGVPGVVSYLSLAKGMHLGKQSCSCSFFTFCFIS